MIAELPEIKTPRLLLRLPKAGDGERTVQYFCDDQARLAPWSPEAPSGFLTPSFWEDAGERACEDFLAGNAARFRVFLAEDPEKIVGMVSIKEVSGEPFMAAQLGYSVSSEVEGRGIAHEAVTAAIFFAFNIWHLHRLDAYVMPSNVRSIRLLQRLGFEQEGLLRDSMRIRGKWEDHLLFGLINTEES